MNKLLAGLLGLIVTSVFMLSANAGDFYRGPEAPGGYKDAPYVPVAGWGGFYFGVNGGGGWSEVSDQLALPGVFNGLQPSGGFAGLQVGYNWGGGFGYSPIVLGFEADIQASAIKDHASDGLGNTLNSRLEEFGTVRGRIGYAVDQALFYVTGGFAYGGIKNEASFPGQGADFKINTTAMGYVLGAGVEYKFTPALSLKGEYQYINLGKNDPVDPVAGAYSSNGGFVRDDAFHTVRVGLNYYIYRAYEPLK
jgi:outer membrane immunogenic protein